MARLKVLFITAWYPTPERPTHGIFVAEHAKAARLFDDIVVLHWAGPDPSLKGLWRLEREVDEEISAGIPTYRIWHRDMPQSKISYLVSLWAVWRGFRRLASEGFRPDIIHAHVYKAGFPAVLIGKLMGVPVVVTEHSTAFPRRLLYGWHIRLARFTFRYADVVLPVSAPLQKAIEGYGICARFHVVPNAVDTRVFRPAAQSQAPDGQKRLLLVCNLDPSPKKGITCLLQALARLRRRREDWRLDIVGDGPGRAEYERTAHALGLASKIIFHGHQPKEQVAQSMRQADLLVVPSLVETFSVVAAEALVTGLPVLATRCGGPEGFVSEEVGRLVAPGDADALCDGLADMMDHLAALSRERIWQYAADRFGPERVGAQLHQVYEECLSSRRECHGITA